jgi:glycosyltransferase involved in cell wall biosynthesis
VQAASSGEAGQLTNRETSSFTFFIYRMSASQVSILTAGRDKPYALGLAAALAAAGTPFDFIASDEVDAPFLHGDQKINFFNLRGDQAVKVGAVKKISRVLVYYFRLLCYALTARPKIFHILWNNKFEWFDRTGLMFFYRLLGKKIVLTAHNVNAGVRDGCDSWWNRLTLKIQYRLCAKLFVHTKIMKAELVDDFGISPERVVVIPMGFFSAVPNTDLTPAQAKQKLGLRPDEKAVLFFGNIAAYKGVEYLVTAFTELARRDASYRLIIVGRPKGAAEYWAGIEHQLDAANLRARSLLNIDFIPDEAIELYLKGGDVLVQPYTHIFQSGVLILGMSFGIPVIAADVGALKDDVVEGQTGYIFPARDAKVLEQLIEKFFASEMYRNSTATRREIRNRVLQNNSWSKVAEMILETYRGVGF